MASSSSTSTGNQMNLATFSWLCPGLHGPGTRQDIGRRTFGGFLKADDSRVANQQICFGLSFSFKNHLSFGLRLPTLIQSGAATCIKGFVKCFLRVVLPCCLSNQGELAENI